MNKKAKYILCIIAGWSFIFALIYLYVIKQRALVHDWGSLSGIIVVGAVLGFLFSCLEASLLSAQKSDLEAEIDQSNTAHRDGKIDQQTYSKLRSKYDKHRELLERRDFHVAPLVIFSNLAGMAVAAFIPIALVSTTGSIKPIIIDFSFLPSLPGYVWIPITIPGEGTKTLTLCSSALALIIFGKILPKKYGAHPKRNLVIVKRWSWLIKLLSFCSGWLGVAVNAIVDLFFGKEKTP